jgi:hypothetical protein
MEKNILLSLRNEKYFENFVHQLGNLQTHDITHLKAKTQIIGNEWEDFCCHYLVKILGWTAYKLKDVDQKMLSKYHLKRRDVGIDIIAFDCEKNSIAIQCKFRKKICRLSWRDVSTFDALAFRTGPWEKKIIMTTAKSIHREGTIQSDDLFWGKNYFETLQRHEWLKIAGCGDGQVVGSTSTNTFLQDINTIRCNRFER